MEKGNSCYCVIMAGGIGSRFWPLSRKERPKQFIDILGTGKTFIRQTYERFLPLVPPENFLVVTSDQYKKLVLEELPELKEEQVLCEPVRRNTAPCIAYAAHRIAATAPQATMIVAPSDHLITNEHEFIRILKEAVEFTEKNDVLMTIGIKPNRPETGYGYIQINNNDSGNPIYKVKTFTEKPNEELAKLFVESGEFFWNSGIFIWSLDSIIHAFEKHIPEIDTIFEEGADIYCTEKEQEYINSVYPECRNISIDYGIMEHAENVYVYCADFGWSDVGTWRSLFIHSKKDENNNAVVTGKTHLVNTSNCLIKLAGNKSAIIEGLDNYIIADSGDILLICNRDKEQEIRNYSEQIEIQEGK